MQKLYLMWFTKSINDDKEIDETYKKILNSGLLMYQHLHFGNQEDEKILELAKEVNEMILLHMHFEIATMEKLNRPNIEAHQRDHEKYIKRFDLEFNYEVSVRMRIIMSAKMVKEYLSKHFYDFDIPDLQEIREHFKVFEKLAS